MLRSKDGFYTFVLTVKFNYVNFSWLHGAVFSCADEDFNRVPTHLENLENSWNFVNLENSWNFMLDLEFLVS